MPRDAETMMDSRRAEEKRSWNPVLRRSRLAMAAAARENYTTCDLGLLLRCIIILNDIGPLSNTCDTNMIFGFCDNLSFHAEDVKYMKYVQP